MTTAAQFNAKMGSFGSFDNFASTEIGFVPSNAIAKGNWLTFKGFTVVGQARRPRSVLKLTKRILMTADPIAFATPCHAARRLRPGLI